MVPSFRDVAAAQARLPRERTVWVFAGGVRVAAFAAGRKPVVLVEAPVGGLSKLEPEAARELAGALRSAALIAEDRARRAARAMGCAEREVELKGANHGDGTEGAETGAGDHGGDRRAVDV